MSAELEKVAMGVAMNKDQNQDSPLTLAQVRTQLKGVKGKKYWRSIDELAGTPEFEAAVAKEFPDQAQEWVDPVSRRGFLKLMSASMALAGLAGCTKQPDEPIYPYVKQPEDLILGKANYFATAHPFPTGGVPLLVKSDAYRPIKVDGNPDHPYNQGSSDPFTQGTLLDLYDPDRSQHATLRGANAEWVDFLTVYRERLAAGKANGGDGIYFLSSTITSPTLARQWKEAQAAYPKARLIQYDPINRDSVHAVLGEKDVQYSLDDADVVVTLDADFLSGASFPGFHKLTREFVQRRKLTGKDLNRLYSVESTTTTTGMKAEHRLGLRASEIPAFAAALASAVGVATSAPSYSWTAEQAKYLAALAKDLKAHAGRSVVIAGEQQDPSVLALALAINETLGNTGKTVFFTDSVQPLPSAQNDGLKSLVADMNGGKVDWLIILDSNPVYSSPVDLNFKAALGNVKTSVHLGSHIDETGAETIWHLPAAHYLETWSDVRAYDGTVSVIQPLIEPLYNGHSAHQIFQGMLDDPQFSAYEAVRETWKPVISKSGEFELGWRKVLHSGWIDGTAFDKAASASVAKLTAPAPSSKDSIEIIFRADPTIFDGRYSNVGWLQELPKPVTNLSWDNAALMSGATLTRLDVEEGDILEINLGGRAVRTPVLVVPGHPDNSVSLYLGYGREAAGRVGSGQGFNAFLIRNSSAPLVAAGASLKKVDGKWGFAVTKSHYQDHRGKLAGGEGNGNYSLETNEAETRGIIRSATWDEFKANPGFANEGENHPKDQRDVTLFPNWEYKDNAWGMSIDLNSCVGCNACIVSCYAENNIAVVGKQQVRIGRNMQWLRIDTYFEGDLAAPRAHFQPMACQHCENAPCEQVCPVGATVHTPEGLNTMVYNRCVGTRYCSNNCPYKVRRFNFLLFSDYETESLKLMRNPDVSVRSRGVMEKCSYCVQRISEAKINADKENRAVLDGEIVTACQQACPASAITFGNINDKSSKIAKLHDDERSYSVLADLNTRPRTRYMAAVLNPNPELAEAPEEHAPAKG
ncbi:TAT-variant-translocated molybdopterin oxidoreductase [Acidicapsa ligni]|uniref:TAT-variant-translocated molybdopterin oxidoreductase n=1 Tax=Acidicapsa ligni TaxID=542300 RepID=UPI0021E03A03|nr:TAT-variant-translocated molybdopterin oxidoreductase [Acidicapsa ligni]